MSLQWSRKSCIKVDTQSGRISSHEFTVQITDRQFFPADLVLLSTTNPEGICYIETMNLDGETNLKMKKGLKETWDLRGIVSTFHL